MSTWCECAIVEGALLLIMMRPEPRNLGPPLCWRARLNRTGGEDCGGSAKAAER